MRVFTFFKFCKMFKYFVSSDFEKCMQEEVYSPVMFLL